MQYEYDKNGHEAAIKSYLPDDSLAWQNDFEYDDRDNVTHSERYSHLTPDGHYDPVGYRDTAALDTYRYKYDKYGNWTQEIVSRRGKIGWRYERMIRYY